MTSYVLRLFGIKIASLDVFEFEIVEEEDEAVSESAAIGGGSAHNFDRDFNAPIPGAEKDFDSWVERPFGFRRP